MFGEMVQEKSTVQQLGNGMWLDVFFSDSMDRMGRMDSCILNVDDSLKKASAINR